jgi:hypothetical protein
VSGVNVDLFGCFVTRAGSAYAVARCFAERTARCYWMLDYGSHAFITNSLDHPVFCPFTATAATRWMTRITQLKSTITTLITLVIDFVCRQLVVCRKSYSVFEFI